MHERCNVGHLLLTQLSRLRPVPLVQESDAAADDGPVGIADRQAVFEAAPGGEVVASVGRRRPPAEGRDVAGREET